MCYINTHVSGEKKIKTKINTQWRATSASEVCQMGSGVFLKESSYFKDII